MGLRKWDAVIAALLAVAVVAVVIMLLPRDAPSTTPPAGSPRPSAPAPPTGPGALVVKIDNVSAARPQTGLGSASTVYVEPVEGGLTRLAAVYTGRLPDVVGPVRSARETDVQLLAAYRRPVLAHSGAAPELRSLLARAPLVLASPRQAPGAYYRSGVRPSPHNLYLRPSLLPARTGASPARSVGPAPPGGRPVGAQHVAYRAASYDFTWSARAGRWLVSMDGTPLTSGESGRVGAATVVVQRVGLRGGSSVRDASGNASPVVRSVGSGDAVVLRDGRRFTARWSRPDGSAPTTFTSTDGARLPMARGPVWILLVPG
ncbi:MAG: DUF3048 domain-containing protein [Pseudonocardiaceae bacterium]|nr:DUF3048 domain-containing protein [Pseudonocardiaceae bacterium]